MTWQPQTPLNSGIALAAVASNERRMLPSVLPSSRDFVSVVTPPVQRFLQGWTRRQPARLSAGGTLDVGAVAGDLHTHALWSTASAALAWWQAAGPSMARRQRLASTSSDATVPGQSQEAGDRGSSPSSAVDRQPRSGSHSRGGSGSVRTSRISSLTADAAALVAPHSVLQLHFEVSLAAASRLQLLDAQDSVVAVVSGTGSLLRLLTSQTGERAAGSRGSIAEERPPLSAGASFTTPIRPQHRRVVSSVPSATSNALHQVRSAGVFSVCYLFAVGQAVAHTKAVQPAALVTTFCCLSGATSHTFQVNQRCGCTCSIFWRVMQISPRVQLGP